MKNYLFIFVLCVLFATSACSTPRERFYDDKASVIKVEGIEELKSILRSALEESDEFEYEIESTFVTTGYHGGRAVCTYHVLTTDGKYLEYNVHGAERIIRTYHVYYDPYADDKIEESIGKYYFDGKEFYCN